jgi:hypothetical protein
MIERCYDDSIHALTRKVDNVNKNIRKEELDIPM